MAETQACEDSRIVNESVSVALREHMKKPV